MHRGDPGRVPEELHHLKVSGPPIASGHVVCDEGCVVVVQRVDDELVCVPLRLLPCVECVLRGFLRRCVADGVDFRLRLAGRFRRLRLDVRLAEDLPMAESPSVSFVAEEEGVDALQVPREALDCCVVYRSCRHVARGWRTRDAESGLKTCEE